MNTEVTAFIDQAKPEQKQILEKLRKLIHESVEDVEEEFKWSRPVFKSNKDFAYFKTAKAYVTLGFFNFEKLNDQGNRLEGTGKNMRHIKLKSLNDIDAQLFKAWFKAAAQ